MSKLKNFLNLRVSGISHSKILYVVNHNLRVIKNKSNVINDNKNISIDLTNNGEQQFYKYEKDKSINKKIKFNIMEQYKQDRKEQQKIYNERNNDNRKLKDSKGTYAEFVFTFSEAVREDLNVKYSTQDLIDCAKDLTKDLENIYGFKGINLVLHLDEKTPHFHLIAKNFDDEGLSLTYKYHNRKDLSAMQDLIFENFKKLGMDRGIKKDNNDCGIYDYTRTKIWKEKQLYEQNQSANRKFDEMITYSDAVATITKELNKIKAEVKLEYTNLNNIKNEIKSSRSNLIRTSDEYKNLTLEYKKLQEEEQKKRSEYKNLTNQINTLKKSKKEFQSFLSRKTEEIIDNSKGMIGFDEDKLKNNIKRALIELSKLNIQLDKLSTLEVDYDDLEFSYRTVLEKLESQEQNLQQIENLKSKYKALEDNLSENYIHKDKVDHILSKNNQPTFKELEQNTRQSHQQVLVDDNIKNISRTSGKKFR